MPSTYSASGRFTLQATGENNNTWGVILNTGVFQLIDTFVAGWLTLALTGDVVLSTANGASDQARNAFFKFTGGAGPFTIRIPAVSKSYDIWNATTGNVVITTAAGTTVTIRSGEIARVICDGADVKRSQGTDFTSQRLTNLADPTGPQDAATKAYADALAFTANAGILPGQGGNTGNFLTTNGTTALWRQIQSTDLGDYATRILGVQVALAVAL